MNENLLGNPYLEFTLLRNTIFDALMPALSSDAWKVLCVALRRTWGGDAVNGGEIWPPRIRIAEFAERAGIVDQTAVENAVAECVDAGCLVTPASGDAASGFVLSVGVTAGTSPAEAGAAAAPAERIVFPPELEPALDALVDFAREMDAVPDPKLVQRVVIDNGTDAVLGWITAGRLMTHLEPPERFQTVLDRLLQGVPPLPLSMLEFGDDVPDGGPPVAEARPAIEEAASALDVSTMSAGELWQTALKTLKGKMRSSKYKFLAPTVGLALEGDVLTVGAANERVREWLESGQLASLILETFQSIAGETMTLKFVVEEG